MNNNKTDPLWYEDLYFPKKENPKVYKPKYYKGKRKTEPPSESQSQQRSSRSGARREQSVQNIPFKNSIRLHPTKKIMPQSAIPLLKGNISIQKSSKDVQSQLPKTEKHKNEKSSRNKRRADSDGEGDTPNKRFAQNLINKLYELKPERQSNVVEYRQYVKNPSWYQSVLLQQIKKEDSCSSCDAVSLPEIRRCASVTDRITKDLIADTSSEHQPQSSTSEEQQDLTSSSTSTLASTTSEDSIQACTNNSTSSLSSVVLISDPEESSGFTVADVHLVNSGYYTMHKLCENIKLANESMFTNWQQVAHALTSPATSDLSDSCSSCRSDDTFSTVTPLSSEENTRYSFSGKHNVESEENSSNQINSQEINSNPTVGPSQQRNIIIANTNSANEFKKPPVPRKIGNNISSVDTNSNDISVSSKQDPSYRDKIILVNTNSAKELKEPACPQKIKNIDVFVESNSQECFKIPGPVTRSSVKLRKLNQKDCLQINNNNPSLSEAPNCNQSCNNNKFITKSEENYIKSPELNTSSNQKAYKAMNQNSQKHKNKDSTSRKSKNSSKKSVTSIQNRKETRKCTRHLCCSKQPKCLKRRFDNIMKPIKAMSKFSNFIVSANGYNSIIKCPKNRCIFKHVNFKAVMDHFQYRHPNRHGLRLFSCNECRQKYSSKFILDLHVNYEHPRLNRCPICFKFFGNFKHLEIHGLEHEFKKFYECEICLRQFASAFGLRYHLARETLYPSFHKLKTKRSGIICSRKSYNY